MQKVYTSRQQMLLDLSEHSSIDYEKTFRARELATDCAFSRGGMGGGVVRQSKHRMPSHGPKMAHNYRAVEAEISKP